MKKKEIFLLGLILIAIALVGFAEGTVGGCEIECTNALCTLPETATNCVKFDNWDQGPTFPWTLDCITIYSNDGKTVNWESTCPVYAMYVKGGPDPFGKWYCYPDGATSGSGSIPGGYAISHVTFCYGSVICCTPVIIECPDPIYVQCDSQIPAYDISSVLVDESCPAIVTWVSDVPNQGTGCLGNPLIITRTYRATATDECHRTADCTQLIYVEDTEEPVLPTLPQGGDLGCNPTPPSCTEDLMASDDCDGDVSVVCTAGTVEEDGCMRSQDFTYTAEDQCGNEATETVTYTWKVDTAAPVLNGCPTDNPTVQCYADIPAADTVTALDDCDGEIDVSLEQKESKPGSSCKNVITRTWTAKDECGNTASCTQTVTVDDTQAPVLPELPTGGDLGCNPTPPSCTEGLKAIDDCNGEVPVVCTPGTVVKDGCARSQTFTYSAKDKCGNEATDTVTYTWKVDTTAPILKGCPTDNPTVQCYADIPAADTVTALDDCDGEIEVSLEQKESNPGSSCKNVITRTWTAKDECGNTASCTQTVTVDDTKAPVLPELPKGGDLGCNPTPPSCTEGLKAIDDCDDEVPVVCTAGTVVENGCARSQTFTYSAKDKCGNEATDTVTYTWKVDTTAPVLKGCPTDNPTVQCYADIPVAATVTALDECDGEIEVSLEQKESNPGSSCKNVITRTWTAKDECGNTASCTQTVTVDDTKAPVLPELPKGGDLGCNPTPPSCTEGLKAIDDCDDEVPVVCTAGTVVENGCARSQTFTYSAKDKCGNEATDTVTYTWKVDTQPPMITCPGDMTINCPAEPVFTPPQVSDTCDAEPTLTFSDVRTEGAYPGEYCVTRTWTATDDCGNSATCTQKICVICHECETAWAFLDGWECFPKTGNWGSLTDINPGDSLTLTGDVWAGRAKCDQTKGWKVGTATITVSAKGYDLDLSLNDDCKVDELHVWVNNAKPVVEGGFSDKRWYKSESMNNLKLDLTKPIWVAVHTVTCCSACNDGCTYPAPK
jgi:hypothetical protein